MRWFALAAVLLLAGCIRPLSSDQEPDRESVNIPRGEFFGEVLSVNGTMRLSVVPGEVAGAVSEEPVNCFAVEDADDERESFLGGISVDLAWTPVTSMMETLNVTVDSYGGYSTLREQGKSPLHIVIVDNDEIDFRTPLAIRVAPAGLGAPVPDQPIAWTVKVGILESAISGLRWRHCDANDLPVPVPPGSVVPAVPSSSSVLLG